MTQLEYIRNDNLKANIEGGRSLALNSTQVAGLKDNFKQKVPPEGVAPTKAPDMIETPELIVESPDAQSQQPIAQEPTPVVNAPQQPIAPEPAPVVTAPQQPIAPEPVPAVNAPQQPVAQEPAPAVTVPEQSPTNSEEPVINLGIPFDSGIPMEQPTANTMNDDKPVIDLSTMTNNNTQESQVEIIPNGKNHNTAYDLLTQEIKRINDQYNQQIAQINEKRQVEIAGVIEAAKQGILDLQEQASEHLKNAQAAEQIAHIAFNNAQSNQTKED